MSYVKSKKPATEFSSERQHEKQDSNRTCHTCLEIIVCDRCTSAKPWPAFSPETRGKRSQNLWNSIHEAANKTVKNEPPEIKKEALEETAASTNKCWCIQCENDAAASDRFKKHCTPLQRDFWCARTGCGVRIAPHLLDIRQRNNAISLGQKLLCDRCKDDGYTLRTLDPVQCQGFCQNALPRCKFQVADMKTEKKRQKAICTECQKRQK